MTTPAGFARKCETIAHTQGRVTRAGVEAAGLAGKTVVQTYMVAHGVTPGKKLRVGGRVNVRYDVVGYTNATALLRMVGPAHIVDRPTKPHVIGAKGLGTRASIRERAGGGRGAFAGRSRRRRGVRALRTPYGPRATVQHPGTPGKGFWERAMPEVRRASTEAVRQGQQAQLLKEFNLR